MCISEVTRLQICDIRFDFFTMTEDTSLFGIAAIHICNRKNDGARSGHHAGPLCPPSLRHFHTATSVGWHNGSDNRPSLHETHQSPFCKPVFLRFDNHELPGALPITIDQPLSVKMAGDAVKRCMSLHDTPWYPRREISRNFVPQRRHYHCDSCRRPGENTLSSERSRLRAP